MAEYFEPGDARGPAIPYRALASSFFADAADRTQKLIPFLGAGASLGPRAPWHEPAAHPPDSDQSDKAIGELGFSGTARKFMQMAICLAAKIQAAEEANNSGNARGPDPVALAKQAKYPPSATELAAALAYLSSYDGFERPRQRLGGLITAEDKEVVALLRWLAELTEIGSAVPPLLSVASYYEFTLQRTQLWGDLKAIFENKKTPTRTHWLIARAAEHFLALRPRKDYLAITTNYDRLQEIAFEKVGVPYCVLTVASADQHVDVRFSPGMREYLDLSENEFASLKEEHAGKYPKAFTLDLPKRVAIVYKLHGCLFPERANRDSVILSDEDYIRYLLQMNDSSSGMVPGEITKLTSGPAFLFLGYSFSDWNVRGIYKTMVKQRTMQQRQEVKDFAVVREFSVYESAFCREGNGRIHLLVTNLNRFARRMLTSAPKRPARANKKAVGTGA